MSSVRAELIELIEEVDQINVDSHPVLLELVQWLPATTIATFIEDARATLELDAPEEEEEDEEDECDFFSSRIPEC